MHASGPLLVLSTWAEIARKLWLASFPVQLHSTVMALLEDSSVDIAFLAADRIIVRVVSGANPIATTSLNCPRPHRTEPPEMYPNRRSAFNCPLVKD